MEPPNLFSQLDQNRTAIRRAEVDVLFSSIRRYRSSSQYQLLLDFCLKFRHIAPFNCLLLHIQRPGSTYVASAADWKNRFGRTVKDDARPLLILVPFGPVAFVFDLEDTEGPEMPQAILTPFLASGTPPPDVWGWTLVNCARDLIRPAGIPMAQGAAGSIGRPKERDTVTLVERKEGQKEPVIRVVPARYRLVYNSNLNAPARYATVVHELAHLYLGHLGTPDPQWWPDREYMRSDHAVGEFEAESVAWLVCNRLGIDPGSERYLATFLEGRGQMPSISIESVLRSVNLIEQMGRGRMMPRKPPRPPKTRRPAAPRVRAALDP